MKIGPILNAFQILLVLFLSSCTSKDVSNPENRQYILGAKIYEHEGSKNELFEEFEKTAINTVFASVDLLSNEEFKSQAKNRGIKTFAILPIFQAPEELINDSSLYATTQFGKHAESEWVKFVCPSDQSYKKTKIEFIKNFVDTHQPDGISLDFIRHFAYWEKIYPGTAYDSIPNTCFDDRCISLFSQYINTTLPEEFSTEYEIYEWIRDNHFEEWVQWKNDLITQTVEAVVSEVKKSHPGILVNLHAVPWRKDDFEGAISKIVGQDFASLSKHVNYISPMTYSHMVKREPRWIHDVVNDIHNNSGAMVLPSIQVGIAYLSDTLSPAEFKQCLDESLKAPSSGVVFWNWDALYADKEKLEIARKRFQSSMEGQ